MNRFLIGLLIFLLVDTCGYSQIKKGFFHVTGKVKVDQGVVDGTHIEIFRDGIRIEDLVVNRTGAFRIMVDLNHNYRFYFSNPSYYPKTIDFNTHVPPEICSSDCEFPPYELMLLLYKKVPGVSEMAQVPGKISYNAQFDVFDAEILRQNSDLKKLISEAINDAQQKSVLYDNKKKVDKKIKYDQQIKDADSYFRSGNIEQAMNTYRDAAMVMPSEKYPRDRVDQAYYLLVTSQMQKSFGNPSENNFLKYLNYGDLKFAEREYSVARIAYENALVVRPDEQSIKAKYIKSEEEVKKIKDLAWEEINHKQEVYASRSVKYKELIAAGDNQLRKESIVEAKDFYAQAATQIEENSYALLMLQKIEEIVSNEELAIKLNRERENAEKQKLNEARNKAFIDAISEADRLLTQRLYLDAIEYYELALTIKEYELYPKKQIESIKDIIAKLQLNGEEYNELIRQGDLLMQQKNYLPAKESFQKAHDLIPDEKYALQKISEIEELLKAKYEEDTINEKYLTLLAEADSLFNHTKYLDAVSTYQKASYLKPTENYPKEQIVKIRGILSRESIEQKLLLQKQAEYDQLIAQADGAFNQFSYQTARSLYLKALQLIPGQEYPSSQIKKIDEFLNRPVTPPKSKLDEIDFSNLQNLSKEDREAAFKEAMEMGESFMKAKEWGLARFYFRRATSLIPTDALANQKLDEADRMIRGGDVNESKYSEFVKKADESFKTGDISVAKFYYAKALELKPNDTYAKERFNVTDQLLRSTISSAGNREFDDAIAKGDEAFNARNYSLARFFYRKALSLKPGNTDATEKISLSEKAMDKEKTNTGNSEYDRNIMLGNQAFQQQNYGVAKNYYKQALTIKPNDEYCKNQLSKIDMLLNK